MFLFTLFFNHFPQYFNALQKASLSLVQSHSNKKLTKKLTNHEDIALNITNICIFGSFQIEKYHMIIN